MYHFIVKQKLRRAFRDINAGRYERNRLCVWAWTNIFLKSTSA